MRPLMRIHKRIYLIFCIALLGTYSHPSKVFSFDYYGEGRISRLNDRTSPIYVKDIRYTGHKIKAEIKFRSGDAETEQFQQSIVYVYCDSPKSFNLTTEERWGEGERHKFEPGWAKVLRSSHCPQEEVDTGSSSSIDLASKGTPAAIPAASKTNTYKTPSANVSPQPRNTSITQRQAPETRTARNQIHEMCRDARDYQGCVNSHTGNGYTSPSGLSEYERSMMQLRREELERQRNQDRLDRMRDDLDQRRRDMEADHARRRERNKALIDLFNPPSVTCTSMPNYYGGSSTTCR